MNVRFATPRFAGLLNRNDLPLEARQYVEANQTGALQNTAKTSLLFQNFSKKADKLDINHPLRIVAQNAKAGIENGITIFTAPNRQAVLFIPKDDHLVVWLALTQQKSNGTLEFDCYFKGEINDDGDITTIDAVGQHKAIADVFQNCDQPNVFKQKVANLSLEWQPSKT